MKPCFSLLLLLLLVCGLRPDSCVAMADTAAINRLLKSADRELDADSSIVQYNSIFLYSRETGYADGAFLALITKGIKYFEKEDYEMYRSTTEAALPWAAKSTQKDAVAWCYINIGEAYFSEGDYTQATDYYYRALHTLQKATGDEPNHTLANTYNSLGQVHIRMNQPEQALYYYSLAEDVGRRAGLYYQLANTAIYKGQYYTGIGQTDSATRYYQQAMDIGRRLHKLDLQAIASTGLGKNYIQAGQYAQAITCFDAAIALARHRYDYIVVDAASSAGDALCHLQRYREAETMLDAALKETRAHNYKDYYIACYSRLQQVYRATGQYLQAIDCMDTLMALKDRLLGADNARAVNLMEVKYKTADKDREIARNQLQIARQNNKLVRKNLWIGATAACIALLVVLVVVVYRNVSHQQRLQQGEIKGLRQENTISVLKGMVQGQEQERSRIARELHDGLGGTLSAAMMRFRSMRHHNEGITQMPAYREAMNMLDKMGGDIRKTAHNLMPEVLLRQPLPEAIRTFCSYMEQEGGVQIDFRSYGNIDNLTDDAKLNIYRVIQELLKNIVQHAGATTVLVQLMAQEGMLNITVEDNGRGFDATATSNGMGLNNLQTRVRSLNGTYTLETAPGSGTTVYMEFELEHLLKPVS